MPHIIWDWNGTLLDDTEAALKTLNIMIAERGGKPIDMRFYLDNFAFPVRPFYDTIGIIAKDEGEWDYIAHEYHEVYLRQQKGLNRGAIAALESAKAAGCGQSILSALRQDLLEEQTAEYGIAGYFEGVYGSNNLDGASKLDRARELISSLSTQPTNPPTLNPPTHQPASFVLIGDALHDKEVADAIGVPCILCAQGSHAAWRLREVAPTVETLADAVRAALKITVA